MSSREIDNLLLMDPEQFNYREWLALKYAQDWAFLDGGNPDAAYIDEFNAAYSDEEKKRIYKLLKIIQFANYWNNTFQNRPLNPDLEGLSLKSCALPSGNFTPSE